MASLTAAADLMAAQSPTAPLALREKVSGKFPSYTNTDATVTVIMKNGEMEIKYKVFKDFVCYYSPMLNAAFNGPFIGGRTQTIAIDDFPYPRAFGLIQGWMYTQKITNPHNYPMGIGGYSTVWVLADRLLMPKLQNEAVIQICANKKLLLTTVPRNLDVVYDHTSPDSKLRKLVVDLCALEMDPTVWATGGGGLPPQFLVDVGTAATNRNRYVARQRNQHRLVTLREIRAEDYLVLEHDV